MLKVARHALLLSNFAVILGVLFALFQINLSAASDKRRIAIEAVVQVRSIEFQKALARINAAYNSGALDYLSLGKDDALVDDINQVMNVYDHIAILYINDVADRCIIKESIYSAVRELSKSAAPFHIRQNTGRTSTCSCLR